DGSYLYANIAGKSVDVGAVHLGQEGIKGGTSLTPSGGGSIGSAVGLRPEQLTQLKDGKNEMVVQLEVAIGNNPVDPPALTRTIDLKDTFMLVPAGAGRMKINRDPTLRAAMVKAITCPAAAYGKPWNAQWLSVEIHLDRTPASIGFEVFAKVKG